MWPDRCPLVSVSRMAPWDLFVRTDTLRLSKPPSKVVKAPVLYVCLNGLLQCTIEEIVHTTHPSFLQKKEKKEKKRRSWFSVLSLFSLLGVCAELCPLGKQTGGMLLRLPSQTPSQRLTGRKTLSNN